MRIGAHGAVSSPHLGQAARECLRFAVDYMRSIVGTATGKTNSPSINFFAVARVSESLAVLWREVVAQFRSID
jgi:hypothetical protein